MPELLKDQLASFCVDHLLVLVGGNPLPNAVAAPLLIKDNGQITLLYTTETEEIARDLEPVLKRRLQGRTVNVARHSEAIHDSHQSSIHKTVRSALDAHSAATVGLHYTAGTKAMSVHAYHAVEDWAQKKNRPRPQFSYLSARDLSLYIDRANPDAGEQEYSCKVGDEVVRLNEMVQMHGGTVNTQHSQPILPQSVQQIVRINTTRNQEDLRKWINWRTGVVAVLDRVEDLYRNMDYSVRKPFLEKDLERVQLSLAKCPLAIATTLRSELNQPGDTLDLKRAAQDGRLPSSTPFYTFYSWVKGTWLESYVLWSLQEANQRNAFGMHDFGMGVEPSFKRGPKRFEMDVIGIRGYQLYAISCAIERELNEGEGRTKWKLFEAILRARQIGGDEARVAFVTLLNNSEAGELVKEAERVLEAGGKVKAFGRDHLNVARQTQDLSEHFAEWIRKA